ncbi:GerAB/ArcD/ProY family transporter [Psychrobacillus vulpis]|uniref:GerAB/ArcD/ProY family transporter n=1 Tax=Psychrobacillus vulpis TaxID=2325572 RepID=UPI003B8487BE
MVTFFVIGTSILIIPGSIASEAKQDAWITCIIGILLNLLLVKLYITVGNLAPEMSLVEVSEQVLGKWFGKLLSFTFFLFSFITAGELVYIVSNFLRTEVMPETHAYPINILFILVIVYGSYLGLETIARTGELLFPIFVLLFTIFVILISPQIDAKQFQPILETQLKPLVYSVLIFSSTFSLPLVVMLMLFPVSINDKKVAQNAFYIGTILGGFVLLIIVSLSISVLGADETSVRSFPSYALAQGISLGNFIDRIEIIMASMWFITIFIKTLFYFYAAVIGLGQILKVKDHRSLILPLGMILVVVSLIIHPSVVHSNEYNKDTWILYVSVYGLFLPLLLMMVNKIRKVF